MSWWKSTEREKWASRFALSQPQFHLGLPALDPRSRELYETGLPRGVLVPRLVRKFSVTPATTTDGSDPPVVNCISWKASKS